MRISQQLMENSMQANILNGKQLAETLNHALKQKIAQHVHTHKTVPGLAVILVGNHPASEVYVKNKCRACEQVGIQSQCYTLPENTSEQTLRTLIMQLNENPAIHGILLQLPLPAHLSSEALLELIRPDKDVDGFHPYNLGRLAQRRPFLRPCTPYGVMQLLETTNIAWHGLHAVVVGASNIVGRPMALELLLAGCTVTQCHRFTKNLALHVQQADILIAAVGKQGVVPADAIKPGAWVVDVGIHRLADGTLRGDLDFVTASKKAAWITPVPGGVGPMTVATLLQNTWQAAQFHWKNSGE